jgi:hypothetical protein
VDEPRIEAARRQPIGQAHRLNRRAADVQARDHAQHADPIVGAGLVEGHL